MKKLQYTIYLNSILLSILLIPLLVGCGTSKQAPSNRNFKNVANGGKGAFNHYIERFAGTAYENQKRYKIPASITLAQGLLESGAGRSQLAHKYNNHFGIKCHSSWRGKRTYHDDDRANECFRVYSSPEASFEDHAQFLMRSRYSRLFRLDIRDYKGWAKGLQACGYATNKAYANRLIKIIEDYQLYLIDEGNLGRKYKFDNKYNYSSPRIQKKKKALTSHESNNSIRPTYLNGKLLYILAKDGDDLATIAEEFGLSEKRLTHYNDFPRAYPLKPGDIVYLQSKLTKAQVPNYQHVVEIGESIHTIAQKYGIKLKSLYSINGLAKDYIPVEGDILYLR